MTFTPYISIYPEGDFNYSWFGNHIIKTIWIFSKNLGYNSRLRRTRINIHLGEEDKAYIKTTGNIKSIRLKNEIDTSIELSDVEKINHIIKIIYQALKAIWQTERWDIELIEKAFMNSIAGNGNFVWYSELKSNKRKNSKARLKLMLDGDKVEIMSEFFDKESNLKDEIKIIDTFLQEVDWFKMFNKPVWIDNEKFGFSLINSQLLIFANTKSRQSETIISENEWTKEEVEGFLRRLSYRQFNNNKELIDWITK